MQCSPIIHLEITILSTVDSVAVDSSRSDAHYFQLFTQFPTFLHVETRPITIPIQGTAKVSKPLQASERYRSLRFIPQCHCLSHHCLFLSWFILSLVIVKLNKRMYCKL